MATLFPHLSSTNLAPSSREVMKAYRNAFEVRVADGSLRPLVIPYHIYGFILLGLYLYISHTNRPYLYAARWPVLAAILAFQWKVLWEATSMSMATGFASGLISVWGMVWAFTWLILQRPQFDAKRVQQRRLEKSSSQAVSSSTEGNGSADHHQPERASLRHREGNGISKKGLIDDNTSSKSPPTFNSEYYWQPYPESLGERFWWISDLIINFRGPGWNWAIPPLPSLPPAVKTKLGEEVDAASRSGISSVGLRAFKTRRELFQKRVPQAIGGYFLLDVLKVVMMKDPYFIFGPTTYTLPPYLQGLSPINLRFIRQFLSSWAIIISLEMVFVIPPIVMCLICGPKVFGLRGEPWVFPTTWGSWSKVMNKGLNGLWGSWWHQTFRFAFSAPSNFLIDNGYIPARSAIARILALVFAFGISGILHAGGSISQFPKTKPWHAMIFFLLQAVGIVIQSFGCSILHPIIKKFPRRIRQAGNFLYVLSWLFYTGWWLTDDFARSGIWLYEPIPISPLRGLGFGEKDAGWWCWQHIGVGWYTGKHWWESGIAL